jgi:hypothetical protein
MKISQRVSEPARVRFGSGPTKLRMSTTSGDSITSAQLLGCVPTALRLDATVHDPIPYHLLMLDRVRDAAEHFDIVHFHIDQFHFPLFKSMAKHFIGGGIPPAIVRQWDDESK